LEDNPAVVSVTATGVQGNDLKVSDALWIAFGRCRQWCNGGGGGPAASQWTTGRA
jgi:hypothetical protein